jgi:hypothetical protein
VPSLFVNVFGSSPVLILNTGCSGTESSNISWKHREVCIHFPRLQNCFLSSYSNPLSNICFGLPVEVLNLNPWIQGCWLKGFFYKLISSSALEVNFLTLPWTGNCTVVLLVVLQTNSIELPTALVGPCYAMKVPHVFSCKLVVLPPRRLMQTTAFGMGILASSSGKTCLLLAKSLTHSGGLQMTISFSQIVLRI